MSCLDKPQWFVWAAPDHPARFRDDRASAAPDPAPATAPWDAGEPEGQAEGGETEGPEAEGAAMNLVVRVLEKAYLAVISVIFVVVLFPLFVIVAVIGALLWWLLRQLLRGLDRYVFVIRKDRGL